MASARGKRYRAVTQMLTSLEFESFRGFTDLTINPLKRINLIAGANNTGKTAILEGLYLLLASDISQLTQLPSVFRSNVLGQPGESLGDDFSTFWQSLFYDKQISKAARVSGTAESGPLLPFHLGNAGGDSIQLVRERPGQDASRAPRVLIGIGPEQPRPGPERTVFKFENPHRVDGGINPSATPFIVVSTRLEQPTRDADLFNQVTLLAGGEEKLLGLLHEIDPRLQKLRYAKAPGTQVPLVYAHFGLKNALSMTQTGQGFSKLFSLFCEMLASKAKVLLIDEIENGLYYESLPDIWKGIATLAASEDIQVFATTHSRECIVAAHETLSNMPDYDFALHRLQRVKGRIEAITHDREMLDVAIKSGMEVR